MVGQEVIVLFSRLGSTLHSRSCIVNGVRKLVGIDQEITVKIAIDIE